LGDCQHAITLFRQLLRGSGHFELIERLHTRRGEAIVTTHQQYLRGTFDIGHDTVLITVQGRHQFARAVERDLGDPRHR